jgi:hypothetical protein
VKCGVRARTRTETGALFHYGGQYLHNKDNDLYRWSAEANLLGTTTGTGKLVAFIGRDTPMPQPIADTFVNMSEVSHRAIEHLLDEYPQQVHSIGTAAPHICIRPLS